MCAAVACPLRKSSWTMGFRMPVTLKVYCNEHQSDGHFLLLNSQFLDTYIYIVQRVPVTTFKLEAEKIW